MAMKTIRETTGTQVLFWCPGCDMPHAVDKEIWTWNGDLERPTFYPSVLVEGGTDEIRCHSFVTVGEIEFLHDCSHKLRGRRVMLPPWPLNRMA
jgi:hypothetical protein